MCQIIFYNELLTSNKIRKWTMAPKVGQFHICALTNVEPRHWGGLQVSGHGPMRKSCFLIKCKLLTPFTSGPWLQKCAAYTLVPSRMYQLLTPLTSGPWLQQWAGFTSVPSPMWNPYTGADTKCQTMESMCRIMFQYQLPTSDTIYKWTISSEVGQFHIGALTDVEPRHRGIHQVSGHGTDVSSHIL